MPIDQIVPFADVPEALDRLGGGVSGKLVAHIADA
jgi:NADPH2:quinone reductase